VRYRVAARIEKKAWTTFAAGQGKHFLFRKHSIILLYQNKKHTLTVYHAKPGQYLSLQGLVVMRAFRYASNTLLVF